MADAAEKVDKAPKKDAPKKEQEKKPEPPPLLQSRQVIAAQSGNQYLVDDMLGKGGFGEVYKVSLMKDRDMKFAMKVEPNSMGKKGPENMLRLKVEIHVFDTIAASTTVDKTHFVKVYDKGITATFKYYVMDIIWSSLKDVITDVLGGVTSPATQINIARQTLKSIDSLHELGFLHRDIKAANYAVGLPPNDSVIYMLDFGISRPFKDKEGKVKVARASVRFMGTLKYASIRSLQDEEQCRKDDLEVWLYMMLQIYDKKNLTWSHSNSKKTIVKMKIELMEKSRELDSAGKLKFPKQYHDIISKIYKMEYIEAGDFKFFNAKLDEIVKEQKIDEKEPLDWIKKCIVEEYKKKEKAKEEKKKAEGEKKDEKKEDVKKDDKKDGSEKKGNEKDGKNRKERKKRNKNMDDDEIMRAMDEMLLKLMKEKRKLQKLKGEVPEDKEHSRSDEDDSEDDYSDDDDSRRRPRGKKGSRKRSRERKRRDYSPRDDIDDTDERDDRDDDRTPERRRRRRSPRGGGGKKRVPKSQILKEELEEMIKRKKEIEDDPFDSERMRLEDFIPRKKIEYDEELAREIQKGLKVNDKKTPEKTPEKPPEKELKDNDKKAPVKTPDQTPEKEPKDKVQNPPEKTPEKTPEKEPKDKDPKSPEKTPEKTPEQAKAQANKKMKKKEIFYGPKSDREWAENSIERAERRARQERAREKRRIARLAKQEKEEREKAEKYAKTPLGRIHGLLTRKDKKLPAKSTNEPAKKADEASPATKEPADAKKK